MIAIIITIISFILLLLYCMLIIFYRQWFTRLKQVEYKNNVQPETHFTIIIPARNEEENIGECLSSIYENDYPDSLFEVIVINDESVDATEVVVQKFRSVHDNLQLINIVELLQGKKINSHKKAAIEAAVHIAKGNTIITTDADCIVPENWLGNFDNYKKQTGKRFIAAPVKFIDDKTFLGRFQCLDFLSLQGITAASVSAGVHSMCNGANLCYDKELFFRVNGFQGIDKLASGDDMLLMQKIKEFDEHTIGYLFSKDSVVSTQTMKTLKGFINQRIRWASKATAYTDKKIIAVLWLVYLVNLFLLIDFFGSFFYITGFVYWLGLIVLKTAVELSFMQKIAAFYSDKKLLKYFPLMQPFHIVYTVVSGFLGRFGKYDWKGRTVQ